ncbi:VOC family protein [Sphingosinicella rhizophila]|uniref:VOC family protein n=1 Tax=Sphingosinicella rhizophila TaxID=3050082 RepID=A0ABU3Q6T4_9SPHN|nr:VOC family protein [Sphingosinicella sp. GR2756]MDT9599027.1 VOC family protein [Sphingosinicella sp. GR2756]
MTDVSNAAPAANAETCQGPPEGTGGFIWYELMTTEQDAAIAFYEAVVGWSASDQTMAEMGDFRYTILSAGDRQIGGLMQLTDEMLGHGARPAWVGYIGVPDTDAAAKQIVAAGGSVHMGPDDIPNVGRFAMVGDPGGAVFYVMTPLPRSDVPPPAEPNELANISWHELYAGNGQEAAFDFYSRQFGWETMEMMDMGPMGQYRIFGSNGVRMGGMMDQPAEMPVSAWSFYVDVDGIDAAIDRITANGGKVAMGPHQVPGGSWIVQAFDPQGAFFALVSTTR